MSGLKDLEMISMQDLVGDSEVVVPAVTKRSFEYNMGDKSAKAKLVKSGKRKPFEIIENSTSSTLVFSAGAWNQVAQPSVKYFNSIKGDKTCNNGQIIVKVASVTAGEDAGKNHIDTLVVFFIRIEIRLSVLSTTRRNASS